MPAQIRVPTPNSSRADASRFFPSNRRDGARLLSTALVITAAGLIRIDHPVGRLIVLLAGGLSLFWWLQYRKLTH